MRDPNMETPWTRHKCIVDGSRRSSHDMKNWMPPHVVQPQAPATQAASAAFRSVISAKYRDGTSMNGRRWRSHIG